MSLRLTLGASRRENLVEPLLIELFGRLSTGLPWLLRLLRLLRQRLARHRHGIDGLAGQRVAIFVHQRRAPDFIPEGVGVFLALDVPVGHRHFGLEVFDGPTSNGDGHEIVERTCRRSAALQAGDRPCIIPTHPHAGR